MLSLRFTIPSPVSADEERVSSYWATSEGLREGDGVGQPICRPPVAAVQFWAQILARPEEPLYGHPWPSWRVFHVVDTERPTGVVTAR